MVVWFWIYLFFWVLFGFFTWKSDVFEVWKYSKPLFTFFIFPKTEWLISVRHIMRALTWKLRQATYNIIKDQKAVKGKIVSERKI